LKPGGGLSGIALIATLQRRSTRLGNDRIEGPALESDIKKTEELEKITPAGLVSYHQAVLHEVPDAMIAVGETASSTSTSASPELLRLDPPYEGGRMRDLCKRQRRVIPYCGRIKKPSPISGPIASS
jgi:hypothetical protein